MFWAAANRLDRCPHIAVPRHQVPARLPEISAADASGLVDSLLHSHDTVGDDLRPDIIAIAAHDCVSRSMLQHLFGKERCMDPAKNDECAIRTSCFADLVTAQRVSGMDPYADDVSGTDRSRIRWIQRLVGDVRVPIDRRSCGGQHVKPAWRDDASAKRRETGVDQMDAQRASREAEG